MPEGISIREFARRDGCNDKLVRRALESKKLRAFSDGTLDPALVGTGWRLTNRRSPQVADTAPHVRAELSAPPVAVYEGETPAQAAERITVSRAAYDQAEAERIKENYLALLRQLEYDTKAGSVVPTADVAKIVGEEYARVRTKLMAIPAEQAPRINRLKTVAEVQDALLEVIIEALEELTRDRAG